MNANRAYVQLTQIRFQYQQRGGRTCVCVCGGGGGELDRRHVETLAVLYGVGGILRDVDFAAYPRDRLAINTAIRER